MVEAWRDKVFLPAKNMFDNYRPKFIAEEDCSSFFAVTLIKGKKYKYCLVEAGKCLNFKIRIVAILFLDKLDWSFYTERQTGLGGHDLIAKIWASKAVPQTSCWSPALLPPQIKHLKVLKPSCFTWNIFLPSFSQLPRGQKYLFPPSAHGTSTVKCSKSISRALSACYIIRGTKLGWCRTTHVHGYHQSPSLLISRRVHRHSRWLALPEGRMDNHTAFPSTP